MSNPNFVSDLVAMAKAFEELPQVKQDLADTERDLSTARNTIADREQSIVRLKQEIETHLASIRTVEAQRDDAEMRFLELDERVGRVAKSFQAALEAMDSTDRLVQALEPPTPAAPTVQADAPATVSETSGGPALEPSDQQVADASGSHWDNASQSYVADIPSQGQSEHPLPDVSAANTPQPSAQSGDTVHETTSAGTGVSQVDPGPMGIDFHGDPRYSDSVSSGPSGERAVDPTLDHRDPTGAGTGNVQSGSEPPRDDVGYHNEPDCQDYHDWDRWFARMNLRYGLGNWPSRYA